MTIPQSLLAAMMAAAVANDTSPPTADRPAKKPAPAVRPPGAPVASLPSVEGELVEVDHRAHRLRLRTTAGEVLLAFDRNTLVRTPAGAATPLHLVAGAKVRAGRDGDARAAWVEVLAPPSTPKPGP
jgi:hypothetical protein